ncbi:hypothetical protein V5799_019087 [Amblyomma americanum]|uniref:Uncharacterized protein n=1 Tax=Amblyomma americanum TaxID=6943 RepID=A0AAQ4EYB1_AMBAM
MDAADMEETSAAKTATAAGETNAVETSQQDKIVAEEGVTIREPAPRQDAGPRSEVEVKSPVATGAPSIPPDPVSMDMSSGAANLAAGKRPHDDGESPALQQDGNGGDKPPSKAAGCRSGKADYRHRRATCEKASLLAIDPANQDVRLKLHWLLHSVPDDEVRAAFAPYGKNSETAQGRWLVHGMTEKGSTTRSFTLKMKADVKLDDLQHQLNVGGELALVVPGRPPLCLRSTGHIRKECRVPRFGVCRRFGHKDGQCARTYASITGPETSEDSSELLMDEADAGEAAGSTGLKVKQDAPSLTLLTKQKVTAASADKASEKSWMLPPKTTTTHRKKRRKFASKHLKV